MKKVLNIDRVAEYNRIVEYDTLHPMVSVIDFSKTAPQRDSSVDALRFGFYAVFLKEDGKHCTIRYGRNLYDYEDGTLVFIGPGQVISIEEDGEDYQPSGYALLFHPDLLHETPLGRKINEYSFFSYAVHEALHISKREREIVLDLFSKIDFEMKQAIDKHSKKLIASIIELFLNFCERFYDRQFITRDNTNKGILEKFESLLNEYFQSDKPQSIGIPSVSYCAEQLFLSANYFGDLVKKETGKTAQEYIQYKLIEIAKERIFEPDKSISEIAFELGFKYPQHFTRLFKQRVGYSPKEFRNLN